MSEESKVCRNCKIEKPLTDYNKQAANKDGFRRQCRGCDKAYKKAKREGTFKPKKKVAKYGFKYCSKCKLEIHKSLFEVTRINKDGLACQCKKCRKDYRDNLSEERKEINRIRARRWAIDNPEAVKQYVAKENKKPAVKIAKILRGRFTEAVRNNYKAGSAVRDLGCSINWFKDYIEWHFTGDMSWSNHGDIWHMDHIIPLSAFDLTSRDQVLVAVHYTNLQPLTIKDNLKKGAKLDWTREE